MNQVGDKIQQQILRYVLPRLISTILFIVIPLLCSNLFFFQLKADLPGVTVECSSDWEIELDEPQNYVWKIDVQIQVEHVIHLPGLFLDAIV